MSWAAQASLNSRTISARSAGAGPDACDAATCRRALDASLPACLRGATDDLCDLDEGVAEDVVEDERDPLGRGHRLEHDQERHADRLVEGDAVSRVDRGAVPPAVDPVPAAGHGLRHPLADVALPPDPRRPEHVEADPARDLGQPGARCLDGLALLRWHGEPADVGLLDDVLGVGHRAEHPIGDSDQPAALTHDHLQARVLWCDLGQCLRGHGRRPSSELLTQPDTPGRRDVTSSPASDTETRVTHLRSATSVRRGWVPRTWPAPPARGR